MYSPLQTLATERHEAARENAMFSFAIEIVLAQIRIGSTLTVKYTSI